MAKRVTMADVAKKAGVSTATVSLALSSTSSRIPEVTAEKVRAAAKELGYLPDVTARTLRTGNSQLIGFISDEVTVTRFASAMVRGILDGAERAGYDVIMTETGHDTARFEKAIRVLEARGVDGIIIGMMASRSVRIPKLRRQLPVVIVNGIAKGRHSVLPDEYRAGTVAVNELVSNGHRRIALIGRHPLQRGDSFTVNIPVRLAAIDDAMSEAGLEFVYEVQSEVWEPEVGYDATLEILDNSEGVTAILAANDRLATGVYQALKDRNLKIPADVSVMSFDDEDLARIVRPPLTTMRLPYREMGETAVSELLDLVKGKPIEESPTLLTLPLIRRTSVAKL